jgi:hypothetical protein
MDDNPCIFQISTRLFHGLTSGNLTMITQFRTQQICMLNRINKVNLTKCETKMMSTPPKPRDTE